MERRRGWVAAVAVALACAQPSAGQSSSAAQEGSRGMDRLSFFIGEWDVEVRSTDGTQLLGRARTVVSPILDGRALQSDYYGLGPSGDPVFRGTTVRTWIPSTGRYAVHWAMAELPGYTYLDEAYRDGALHAEGHGFDGQGEFRERYRYYDLSDSTYTFEMSRSYDDGRSWQPFAHLRATKRRTGPGGGS